MLVGLSVGLLVAAGVYFSGWRIDADVLRRNPGSAYPGSAPASARREAPPASNAEPGPSDTDRGERARAAAPSIEAESRFDFYEILPEYEVVVPEGGTAAARATSPAAVSAAGSYILQTGSFRVHSDADRMQASLALLGIESRIQRVTIDDDVYHRVRIGPISDLDQLNRLRARLRVAGVEALTMKVDD